jgi:hypothetical protein
MRLPFGALAAALLFLIPSTRVAIAGDAPLKYQGRIPSDFSLPNAMKSLYGNFDPPANVSVSTLPTTGAKSSYFDPGLEINVRPFWVIGAKESGTTKVFLLTYATPDAKSFGCHACAPLIDMAVFVRAKSEWSVESVGKAIVVFGQWGYPPDARSLRIGPGRIGIELRFTHKGQGETTTLISILVPWKGEVREALSTEIADDDQGMCQDAGTLPCYHRRRNIKFVKAADPDYDEVLLTLSGTTLTKDAPYKAIDANELQHGHFVEGKYVLTPG